MDDYVTNSILLNSSSQMQRRYHRWKQTNCCKTSLQNDLCCRLHELCQQQNWSLIGKMELDQLKPVAGNHFGNLDFCNNWPSVESAGLVQLETFLWCILPDVVQSSSRYTAQLEVLCAHRPEMYGKSFTCQPGPAEGFLSNEELQWWCIWCMINLGLCDE